MNDTTNLKDPRLTKLVLTGVSTLQAGFSFRDTPPEECKDYASSTLAYFWEKIPQERRNNLPGTSDNPLAVCVHNKLGGTEYNEAQIIAAVLEARKAGYLTASGSASYLIGIRITPAGEQFLSTVQDAATQYRAEQLFAEFQRRPRVTPLASASIDVEGSVVEEDSRHIETQQKRRMPGADGKGRF